ncbi:MAG: hypothetical protein FJ387_20290 [Verrucomicrobia bacterium]|nr:hypothetical protein [Verrucomicrobiota bacterium]
MATELNRRSFMRGTLLSTAALAWSRPSRAQPQQPTAPAPSPAAEPAPAPGLPRGKIGPLEISRLLLGGNLLTHYTHSRDLRYVYRLAARYNTDEKILETLATAEAHGINTLVMHNPDHPMTLLRRYRRERGGKIQWIICPTAPVEPDLVKYRQAVKDLVKDGAEAIYLWGVTSDALVNQDRIDLLVKAVAIPKEFGVPSGVGAHSLDVVRACEQHDAQADFYIKTFHHHRYPTGPKPEELNAPYNEFPGYWCRDPEATAQFMESVQKPWIAFKVMAAGAIPPADAFQHAFRHGADFVLAGMFDFEIAEDVQIAQTTLAGLTERVRPWLA